MKFLNYQYHLFSETASSSWILTKVQHIQPLPTMKSAWLRKKSNGKCCDLQVEGNPHDFPGGDLFHFNRWKLVGGKIFAKAQHLPKIKSQYNLFNNYRYCRCLGGLSSLICLSKNPLCKVDKLHFEAIRTPEYQPNFQKNTKKLRRAFCIPHSFWLTAFLHETSNFPGANLHTPWMDGFPLLFHHPTCPWLV